MWASVHIHYHQLTPFALQYELPRSSCRRFYYELSHWQVGTGSGKCDPDYVGIQFPCAPEDGANERITHILCRPHLHLIRPEHAECEIVALIPHGNANALADNLILISSRRAHTEDGVTILVRNGVF